MGDIPACKAATGNQTGYPKVAHSAPTFRQLNLTQTIFVFSSVALVLFSPSEVLPLSPCKGTVEVKVLGARRDSAGAECVKGFSGRRQTVLIPAQNSSRANWPGPGALLCPLGWS